MNKQIRLLDCTLRDGGYINDWCFGKKEIADIAKCLEQTKVDVLELGFLKNEPYEKDRTVFNDMEQVKQLIDTKKEGVQYAVMCEVVNPLPLDMLAPADKDSADIIRVIVWKDKHDANGNIVDALEEGYCYCKGVVEKGYKLCVQPARVDQYSDEEFVAMVRRFSQLNPMAIYVVDSWGTQNPEDLLHYMRLADENMPREITLGYHGHNNMMQALSAAQAMIKEGFDREIMIDASVYGIGRGAGNLNLEIIAKYLNEYYGKAYRIAPMLEVNSKYIHGIYGIEPWGYSVPYYLTAKHNCNPNYCQVLREYQATEQEINAVLSTLSSVDKAIVNRKAVEKALYAIRKKEIGLCIIVPIANHVRVATPWIENFADEYYPFGVDVVFYDSSENDDIQEMVKKNNKPNVFYYRYIDNRKYPDCLCEKVQSAFELFYPKYRYLWACRDRSIPKIQNVYQAIVKMKEKDKDALFVYPHYIPPHFYGERDFTDPCEIALSAGELTSLGSTIYASRVVKVLVQEFPVTENTKGMWIPVVLFHYIADRDFCIGYIAGDNFFYQPYKGSSFWLKNGSSDKLWLEQWPNMVNRLPSVYDSVKTEMRRFTNWVIPPFQSFMLLPARVNGSYSLRMVLKNYRNLLNTGKKNTLKVTLISLAPRFAVKWYMNNQSSILAKFLRFSARIVMKLMEVVLKLFRFLFHKNNAKRYKPYGGERKDYISDISDMESHILFQKNNNVQEPWITIAIPTYQRSKLLESTIASLRVQKEVMYDWDVIVVDNDPYDGTANDTQKLIKRINWDKITYYRNEKNLGAAGNMNRSVQLAKGKWVAILHDDDLLNQDYLVKIEKRIKAAEKSTNHKVAMISDIHNVCDTSLSVRNKEHWEEFIRYDKLRSLCDDEVLLPVTKYEYLFTGGCGVGSPTAGTIYSRECYLEMGGLCEEKSLLDDSGFAFELSKRYSVFRSNYTMGYYRQGDNESSRHPQKLVRDLFDMRERVYQSSLFGRIIGYFVREEFMYSDINYLNNLLSEKMRVAEFGDLGKYQPNSIRTWFVGLLLRLYCRNQQNHKIDCSE